MIFIDNYLFSSVQPSNLMIDACSICQLNCPRCPVTTMGYEDNIKKGYLDVSNFEKLLKNNKRIVTVRIDSFGESLLNPHFGELIRVAHDNNVRVKCDVGVNLNTVSEENIEKIVKYNLISLNCSIDGATQETYEKYRVNGNFKTVIDNIKSINKYKEKYNTKYPVLKWQFIVFGHNEHEISKAKELAHELNMTFYPKTSWDQDFSPINNTELVLRQTGWKYASREEQEEAEKKSFARNSCYYLWKFPRISWDGSVTGCCWNTWESFGGNAFENYHNAINSEKIIYARKMLCNIVPERRDIPCSQCQMYKMMKETGAFIKRSEIIEIMKIKKTIMRYLNPMNYIRSVL
ncbi:MAG: radical SAM protein [Candidatus Electrothrix sp. AR5]|nr:radical SAM protein [Candidatus Electrothrix sp. AR5]